MKRFCLILVFLIIVSIFAGCAKKPSLPEEEIPLTPVSSFASRSHKYAFSYPSALSTGDTGSNMDILLYDASDERYLANFSVSCIEGEVKLDIMTETNVAENFEYDSVVVDSFEFGTFCDRYSLTYTLTVTTQSSTLKITQILFNANGFHYILTTSCLTDQVERISPVFELIIGSFAIRE